jgi:hypothetical protein
MNPIKLNLIRIDGDTQSRQTINKITVGEYADVMTAGTNLPPIVLFFDDTDYWLADGFHRYYAHHKIGALSIDADVREGTRRDAMLHSVGANATHGLRRTNNDKHRAVMKLLNDAEWGAWSDSAIAKKCGVSVSFVGDVRRAISSPTKDSSGPATRMVQRNGKTYTQDTTKIGKAKGSVDTQESPDHKQQDSVFNEVDSNSELVQADEVMDDEVAGAEVTITVLENGEGEQKTQLYESTHDPQYTANGEEAAPKAIEIALTLPEAMARIKQLEELVQEKEARIISLASEKEEAVRLYEEAKHALEQL